MDFPPQGKIIPHMNSEVEIDEVHERMRQQLDAVGLTPNAASVAAGLDKSYLRKLFERPGSRPNASSSRKLSPILRMSIEELAGGNLPGDLRTHRPINEPNVSRDSLPPIPVRGTVAGSHESGAFQFDGSDIEYIDRYPALADRPKVYALYVEGDSMAPEHKPGAIRFVDPSVLPRVGDTVVVTVMDPDRGLFAVLGHLVRRGDAVVIGKLNPPQEIEYPKLLIHTIHHVMTDNELAGRG